VSAELAVPLALVCRVLEAPRSTVYARRSRTTDPGVAGKRGPKTRISDEDLVALIHMVIAESPFAGEGHRKVRARLRREHDARVGRHRVLRLMRREGLLAPQRLARRRRPRLHDGSIIPDRPDVMWGVDATMAHTVVDGWVWVFVCVDHYSAEAWASVAVRGDRFAALEPVYDAVRDHFGVVGPDAARGVACRHDWGPQYTSGHFQGSLRWLGISDSPAFPGEPSCNGCAERFIRTLKEQCLWSRHHHDVTDLRAAVADFVERYNTEWLIERHDHATPREAYRAALAVRAA
jgi:transposase InsO family protein